jgi:Arc/MetJ family transcription regulator
MKVALLTVSFVIAKQWQVVFAICIHAGERVFKGTSHEKCRSALRRVTIDHEAYPRTHTPFSAAIKTLLVYNIANLYTQEADMRTNVVIDDSLMESALKSSGLKTKKDAIEAGLKLLVKFKRQAKIKNYRGKLTWVGDLDKMRTDK